MLTRGPHEVAFVIRGPISRADLPGLYDRVGGVLGARGAVLTYDVAGGAPERGTVGRPGRGSRGGDGRCAGAPPARGQGTRLLRAALQCVRRAPRPRRAHGPVPRSRQALTFAGRSPSAGRGGNVGVWLKPDPTSTTTTRSLASARLRHNVRRAATTETRAAGRSAGTASPRRGKT